MAGKKGFFMRMKNGFKMIATVLAVIAISITGCDSPAGNGGTETGGGNQTPIAGHYAIGNLAQTAGSVTAVTITPNPGASPGAVVNIRYDGDTAIPQTAGTFAVTFDVEAAEGWYAATGLPAGDLVVSATNAGINWMAVDNGVFGTSEIEAIVWGGNRFVAGGGRVAYSIDGIYWTIVEDNALPGGISAIAWGNGKFVAGNWNGRMAYSTDGANWTAVEDSTFEANRIDTIAWGNDRFVAGGTNGRMAHSTDGINWIAIEDSTFETFGGERITAIAWSNGKFVAVGGFSGTITRHCRMAYSTDGINWTSVGGRADGTPMSISIVWGNDRFVAGGLDGRMVYSTDGINWVVVEDHTLDFITTIAWGNGRFVAGGYRLLTETQWEIAIVHSTDGVNWLDAEDSTFVAGNLEIIMDIAWGNNRFVAVGTNGRIAYSIGD